MNKFCRDQHIENKDQNQNTVYFQRLKTKKKDVFIWTKNIFEH